MQIDDYNLTLIAITLCSQFFVLFMHIILMLQTCLAGMSESSPETEGLNIYEEFAELNDDFSGEESTSDDGFASEEEKTTPDR